LGSKNGPIYPDDVRDVSLVEMEDLTFNEIQAKDLG